MEYFKDLSKISNIPCTVVKIEDILITGKNDEEHLKNIEKVLGILNEVGATVNKSKWYTKMVFVWTHGKLIQS